MKPYVECKSSGYSGFSVGMIGSLFVIAVPMGICDLPEYFPITKEEFETFHFWQDDLLKLREIEHRGFVD